MAVNRRVVYPILLLCAAALLWWGQKEGWLEEGRSSSPPPRPAPPAWGTTLPPPREGGPPAMEAPPPVPKAGKEPGRPTQAPPLLLPGTAVLNPRAWAWPGPGIPSLEAAKRLARIRWSPPRRPFPGEERVPDPDGIGPCPPRRLPPGKKDTPVVRRYIDRRSFEPTWVHADGSLTSLNVAVREIPGQGKQQVVQILTKYR